MAKQKLPLADARKLAEAIVSRLSGYCQRIEIAGSIRRCKPEVGDIEIVALPLFDRDMFGAISENHLLDGVDWLKFGKVIKNGHKYKQIELHEGPNLDLFIVTPPAQWGVQFLIRTGSADFSHRFVTQKKLGGTLPSNLRVQDGAIWSNNHIIETPEENDVFALAGIPFVEPEKRS
jgi:DNA polymerase/3'-5' exonuclease PolX